MAAVSIPLGSAFPAPAPLATAALTSANTEFQGELEGAIEDSAAGVAGQAPEAIPSAAILNLFLLVAPPVPAGAFGASSEGIEAGGEPASAIEEGFSATTAGTLLAGAASPQPAAGAQAELAFALRLIDQAANESAPQARPGKAPALEVPHASARPSEQPHEAIAEPSAQNLAHAAAESVPQTIAAAVPANRVAVEAGAIEAVAASSAAEPTEPAPAVKAPAREVTEINLSVGSRPGATAQERIAIRMVQRAGEIHVSVRTPDQDLTQSLRQSLARLSSALDDAGFRAETWRPVETATPAQRDSAPDFSHRRQPDPDARSGNQNNREQGGRRQRRQQDLPSWVSALAAQRIQ